MGRQEVHELLRKVSGNLGIAVRNVRDEVNEVA